MPDPPTPAHRAPRWGRIAPAACVLAAACVFFSPYFRDLARINPNDDWLAHAARHAAVRISLADFGQFPLRTPFFGGGYPTLNNPEDPTLSPFILLSLVFGEVLGLKLLGFGMYLVGALGAYLMARGVYGQSRAAAAAVACVVAFSSWTSTRVAKGNLNELYFLCFPLALWLLAESRQRRWCFVALAMLMAALAMDGKLTWFCMMFFLGLGALRLCTRRECRLDLTPLAHYALLAVVVALLAAPKLLPVAEMFRERGGLTNAPIARHAGYYSPETIEALSLRDVWEVFTHPVAGANFAPSPDNVGLAAVLAAGLGLLLGGWRLWKDCLIAALALLLVMAYHAPVDVFRAFTALPGFNTITVPAKYFDFYLLLFIAVMVGQLVHWAQRRCRRPGVRHAVAAALLAAVLPYEWQQNQPLLTDLFTADMPAITDRAESFYQVQGIGMKTTGLRTLHTNNYYNVLRRVGTIDCFTAIPIPAHAEPKYFVDARDRFHANKRYRSEAWLLKSGRPVKVELTPNRIVVRCDAPAPDTVVVNQNFHPDWRCDTQAVRDHQGLLAVDVPAGPAERVLRYRPMAFYIGLALFALGLVFVALAAWRLPRGHRPTCGSSCIAS